MAFGQRGGRILSCQSSVLASKKKKKKKKKIVGYILLYHLSLKKKLFRESNLNLRYGKVFARETNTPFDAVVIQDIFSSAVY